MKDIVITIFICCIVGAMFIGMMAWGAKETYEKGFHDGYNKYIETFIPAPMLPKPTKIRNRDLIEKFKG